MDIQPYDPWTDLAARHPKITLGQRDLPGDAFAEWEGTTLYLDSKLAAGEARSTLAQEIVHLDDPDIDVKEAAQVTARRLIAFDTLALEAGLLIQDRLGALADRLEVDTLAVVTRLRGLSQAERSLLMARLVEELPSPA